jgi:hypothetical protein
MGKELREDDARSVDNAIRQTKAKIAYQKDAKEQQGFDSQRAYLLWLNNYENTEHTDECLYKSFQEGPFTWHYLNGLELRRTEAPWCDCAHQTCVSCGNPFDMGRDCSHGIEGNFELCGNCCPLNECEPYDYGEYRKIKESERKRERERKKIIEGQKQSQQEQQIKEESKVKRMKIAGFMSAFIGGVFLKRLV